MTKNQSLAAIGGLLAITVLLAYAVSTTVAARSAEAAPDFGSIQNVDEKKAAFFGFVRRKLESVNRDIERDRAMLMEWKVEALAGEDPSSSRRRKLDRILETYQLSDFDSASGEDWDQLLERVDVVPASLALAQAANESAWGTSRFAREGNNFFGHRCFESGCGIVPAKRNRGATYEVRVFRSAKESIEAYVFNLNTFSAFKKFRRQRAALRARGDEPSGLALAAGLDKYSTRGQAYVADLKAMIRANQLEAHVGAGPAKQP